MTARLVAGGIYSVIQAKSKLGIVTEYGVVKLLVVEPTVVHVRSYKNRFRRRPATIDPTALDVGSLSEPGSHAIGHLPLARREFQTWEPVFLMRTEVIEDELDGYHMWQAAGGGVFGSLSRYDDFLDIEVQRLLAQPRQFPDQAPNEIFGEMSASLARTHGLDFMEATETAFDYCHRRHLDIPLPPQREEPDEPPTPARKWWQFRH